MIGNEMRKGDYVMTEEEQSVNEMVDMIVGCFEAATGRTFNSYCDLKQTIHGAILSHGRMMKTKGMIEANENTGKLIKGVFGNG